MMRAIGMGVAKARNEPPQARMWVSVILWNVMNTGAKMPFIPMEMQRAVNTFIRVTGPAMAAVAPCNPQYSRATGTPLEKIIMARLMPMPKMPHTTARGHTPNPRFR